MFQCNSSMVAKLLVCLPVVGAVVYVVWRLSEIVPASVLNVVGS